MALPITISKVKENLRIKHNKLDNEIADEIEACKADLIVCGISDPQEESPLILAAIKLWCRAGFSDDVAKSTAFMERYNAQKACLMMAEGYGGNTEND